jgi:RNA polymerase sigma factor (sigma-70 family)
MPRAGINRVLDRLPTGRDAPADGHLLGRVVRDGDEASFAELVRRHGPMVLGVCRRVTGHAEDAEDAFQATFLVLARKAGTVRPRDAVGGWLHGVALRTALKARARAARRRRVEGQEVPMDTAAPEPPAADPDLARLLDAEIDRLPESLRVPVVLCELEGRPRAEVARRLGIPEGTLSSRLATARKRLAARLASRGGVLPAAGLGLSLTVPAPLAAAAVGVARGAAGSRAVLSLADGVVKAMFLQKLKLIGIAGLAVGLAGGVWAAAVPAPAPTPAKVAAAGPVAAAVLPADPPAAPKVDPGPPDPVRAAFEKLVAADGNWQKERPALDELKALGPKAKDLLVREAERHPKDRIRGHCYELITGQFPADPWVVQQAVRGLSDPAEAVRSHLADWLGEQKVHASHRRLRFVMGDPKNHERTRLVAAKSLARLGEPDVIRALYTGLESDSAVSRHIANLGVKVLTGKTLNDFGKYDFHEGAIIIGGQEAVGEFDGVAHADKRMKRYEALLAFCTWLRKERPDLYKHLAGTF